VFLAVTVFAQRVFVTDGQTDGLAIPRTNIALLGNVRQKLQISDTEGFIMVFLALQEFPVTCNVTGDSW